MHPLHGLKFDAAGKKWILEGVFDASATPLRLDSWQRQRLFCVDGREYSLGDALKFLANREAAHVDTRMDIHAGDMERVHFGSTTYCHIVAVLAGSYVLEQYRNSRKVNKDLWDAFASVELAQLMSPQGSWGAEFTNANIDPMGLPGGAHETGIQIPEPGKPWQPVQISEAWVVSS